MVTGQGRIERLVRVWVPVGFFLVLALFPFYWMAITSIKPNSELYNARLMPLLVRNPTLKHYVDLLTQTSFLVWTWNTMLVAVVSTAISLVFGTMLAYPLARMRFAGAGLIAMTVAAIYLVPQPLLFLPLADVINRLGLGNTLTSVILTYPTMLVPFCAWLLLGYFKTVPKDLEEAARIDGASRLQTMRQIFLPLCTPGFISAGIFAFTLSQNEFLYALIFLTQSSVRTVPVGVIAELIRGDVFYWGQLSVLLGPIDGGSALGLDPGRADLLLLRRALRRRADLRLGEGLATCGAQCAARITSRWSSLRHHATAMGAGRPVGGSTRAAPAEPPSPSGVSPRATSRAEEAIAMPPLRQWWTMAPSAPARTAPSRSPAVLRPARSSVSALRFASSSPQGRSGQHQRPI